MSPNKLDRWLARGTWIAMAVATVSGVSSLLVLDADGDETPAVQGKAAGEESKSTGETQAQAATETAEPAKTLVRSSAGCLVDERSISEFKKRSHELDTKSKELTAREAELQSKTRALEEEIKKLADLQKELAKTRTAIKSENDEKVNRLVETIEGMSPKAAAAMLTALDEGLAVVAISRVATAKLSKIMAQMDQEKSSRLAEALVGIARPKGQLRAPASLNDIPMKGGETRVNQSNQPGGNPAGKPTSPSSEVGNGSSSKPNGAASGASTNG